MNIFEIGKVEVCDLYFFLIESEEIDVYIFWEKFSDVKVNIVIVLLFGVSMSL